MINRLTNLTLKQSIIIAIVIFILDQLTKAAVKSHFAEKNAFIEVLPFFSIVYVQNTGSAFGMFKGLGNMFFITIAVCASAVMSYLTIKDPTHRLVYSLFIAGALGNATDRVLYGFVVDFLDFYIGRYHWPAFNVADSALTVAMGLLIWLTFRQSKKFKTNDRQ